jgi:hypothetical protein
MGSRGEAYAQQFEAGNAALIATVERLSDAQWRAPAGGDDQRPVGVLAYHVATSHPAVFGLAQRLADGDPGPTMTMAMIDQHNAQQAQEHVNVTKDEVLALLRDNGAQVAAGLRGLSDAQLERTGLVPAFGPDPISAAQWIEMVVLGHIGMHAPAIEAAAQT